MKEIINRIHTELFSLQDTKYRKFNSALIPSVDKDTVIGVCTPALKNFAKKLKQEPEISEFLSDLPHKYFEENNLHAFIIEGIKNYDEAVAAVNAFLPFVDNWATCDQLRPKCFKKYRNRLLGDIKFWLASDRLYTVRFGIGMLMCHFLDEDFSTEYPELVAQIYSEEYYLNMMIAWYFATALAKQYDAVLPYFENSRLGKWTHNKSIQKALESNRISDAHKAYLRTLKV